MDNKLHFIITKFSPKEIIFDGMLSFTEARQFMDEHASFERRVGFKVFNDSLNKWEDFNDSYHGGRKVYDKNGCLFILDPDYSKIKLPQNQLWHLWFDRIDGSRLFIQSFGSKNDAYRLCSFLSSNWKDGAYVVESSDINIDVL